MNQLMFTVNEIKEKIVGGEKLLLAGDEQLLEQLPAGNWIGGTIPYFMTEKGGEFTQERIYATELPAYVSDISIKLYDETNLSQIYTDTPENGLSLIILPANSKTHLAFALNAPNYPGFATRPLIGWISGVKLADMDKVAPKVFNGLTRQTLENEAVVMHVTLPADKIAEIDILNIFEQGDGDILTFPTDGFSVSEVFVNGKSRDFSDYLTEIHANTKLPLVADYCGALINISFLSVDTVGKQVKFYAPVFKGVRYKLARPVDDYVVRFTAQIPNTVSGEMAFSCNCILNYLYSDLEGKKTGNITGPITFGEIAYQLLNQTMVQVSISDIAPSK